MLFECLTPKGFQMLGVHGRGPAQSYHYKRFRYTGLLQLDDYLDDQRLPRQWEDVRARLYGDEDTTEYHRDEEGGWVSDATDCDDRDDDVYPDAPELCDHKDNDCDGVIDPDSSEDAKLW